MTLEAGGKFGPYTIVTLLGQGGMGDVYRARDENLNRDVALKVLASQLAHDPDLKVRFRQEAQFLANFRHKRVGAIYGFEEADGVCALVLELIEGPTLEERLKAGSLPVDEALDLALQICDGLAAAHHHRDHKIVHRDLKPGNIKLKEDGSIILLDFGLAKAYQATGTGLTGALTGPRTVSGAVLGTPAYMSPEQACGEPVDQRADIWAFGCVLYEMLTGSRAFDGDRVAEIMMKIVAHDPDWSKLPSGAPPSMLRILRRCLSRELPGRFVDIHDVRLSIEDARRADVAAAGVDVKTVRTVFDYASVSSARIYESIISLTVATTFDEAFWALHRLEPLLKAWSDVGPQTNELIAWIERGLRSFVDGGLPRLRPPGVDGRKVQRKTVECYIQLIDRLADESGQTRVCETFCEWLHYQGPQEALRTETVREFSYELINRLNGALQARAVDAFEALIDNTDDRDLSIAWLLVPPRLTTIGSSVLVRLLTKGFHVVTRDFTSFHSIWVMTIHQLIEHGRLGERERSDLHRAFSGYVQDVAMRIKKSQAKKTENAAYEAFVDVMGRLRGKPRPINCWVPHAPISATVVIADQGTEERIACAIGNVRRSQAGAQPGFWLTSDQPTTNSSHRRASLVVSLGQGDVTLDVEFTGPVPEDPINNQHFHKWGYRVGVLPGQEEMFAKIPVEPPMV